MRRRSRTALLALAVGVLLPALGVAQYAPKWHVGDWWVVKTWDRMTTAMGPVWYYMRYRVCRVEKLNNRDCYVLEGSRGSRSNVFSSEATDFVLYVRADDMLPVREIVSAEYDGKPLPPIVRDYPRGLFGPFGGDCEPRMPRFPLKLGNPDTIFKRQKRDDGSAYLREISSLADSALVKRLLAEGDTLGNRAILPSGAVYEVRVEMGGNLEPGPFPGEPRIIQSLQFWCEGQPWRLYEEGVQYDGRKRTRYVTDRSWLIASSRAEK